MLSKKHKKSKNTNPTPSSDSKSKSAKKAQKASDRQIVVTMLERMLANGAYDKSKVTKSDQLHIGYRKVFTTKYEKVMYTVSEWPMYLEVEMIHRLRLHVERYGVVLNTIIKFSPHTINWDSPVMRERKTLAKDAVETGADKLTNFSTDADRRKVGDLERMDKTFGYYNSITERKRMLCMANVSLELWRVKNDDRAINNFRMAQKDLLNFCAHDGMRLKEVKGDTYEYFISRSPATGFTHKNNRYDSSTIMSDEIVARMASYTGGAIGKTGVLMGRDIVTNKLVYKEFVANGGGAENFIVAAETGSGKSYMIKSITSMMTGRGFNVVILDIDNEYVPYAEECQGVVINFKDSYFDTTEISQPTGDKDADSELLNESRQATAMVFGCLADIEKGMTPTERDIFTKAYNAMYGDAGVLIDDQRTWGNSSRLSYKLLYSYIKQFATPEKAKEINIELKAIQEFVSKLSTFLDDDGLYSFLFKNKVNVNQVFDRKTNEPMIIDIALNMQKNATKGEELIIQTVKQVTANYLSTLIANRNKAAGEFTAEIIEEYNRYANQPEVSDMILTKMTGNRKRNMNTFLITNSPLALLKNGTAAAFAVIESVNNFIIGKLKPKTIDAVCEVFNLDNCNDLISTISSTVFYKNSFLMKLNNREVTIVKAEIPKRLRETKLFKTRDTVMIARKTETIEWKDIQDDVRRKREEGSALLKERQGQVLKGLKEA